MNRIVLRLLGLWLLFHPPIGGLSQRPPEPQVLVERTVTDVLEMAAAEPGVLTGDLTDLYKRVDARVMPYFDLDTMTRLAVGRHWRDATPAQRAAMTNQFRQLLVRTYTRAYVHSNDVKVQVLPVKLDRADTETTVKTRILFAGGAPDVAVDYDMRATGSGWKVYNVTVEGVSLVTAYRAEFAEQIRLGGIDGLIRRLTQKNSTP